MFICVFLFLPSSQLNLIKVSIFPFTFNMFHILFYFFSYFLKRGFRNQIHYPHFGQDSTPVAPGAYPENFPSFPPIYTTLIIKLLVNIIFILYEIKHHNVNSKLSIDSSNLEYYMCYLLSWGVPGSTK